MLDFDPYSPKTLEYVNTKNGRLRGFKMHDIYAFLNVQYGECKRWEAPEPVKPWKGTKNALRFGPRMFPGAESENGTPAFTPWDSCGIAHEAYDYAEDALNLNIWSPSIDQKAKKPVMVWIHGGGYSTGSAMEMQAHYGENLSKFGDLVVVTVNHRLNVFGFMDMSRFGEKYANSANAGIADLVCALEWIRDNIAFFGGDPDNVLIYGQSGGGGKVCTLMQTPAAAGLFHKAVIMSGVTVGQIGGNENISEKLIERLFKKYNTDSIDTLLDLTPEELLDSVNELGKDLCAKGLMGWHPIANDWYLGDPRDVGTLESSKKIPIMIGSTISEFPLMRIFNKHDYSEEQQMNILRECFPDQDVEHLAELFKKAWPEKCLTDAIEMYGAIDFRQGTIEYLDVRAKEATAPTYVYVFGYDFPQDGGRGAWHCSDIPVVFHNAAFYPENFREGLVGELEDAICGSWVNFAHSSDPNNKWLKTEWPKYKENECAVMIFDKPCSVRYDFDRELVNYRAGMKLKITDKYTKFSQVIN